MITNPGLKFSAIVKECAQQLEAELLRLSKEEARCQEYAARKPESVMHIKAWQESIDQSRDRIEYLAEAITEAFPLLLQAEANRRFLKGREYEKNTHSPFVSFYRSDQHKEAERHYSIANQRYIDNI